MIKCNHFDLSEVAEDKPSDPIWYKSICSDDFKLTNSLWVGIFIKIVF